MYDSDFAKEVIEYNMTDPLEILNWYRNLYYTENDNTERGIVARAINDLIIIPTAKDNECNCFKSEDKDEYWGYWIKCECGFDSNVEGTKFCGGCGKKINVIGTEDFYPEF